MKAPPRVNWSKKKYEVIDVNGVVMICIICSVLIKIFDVLQVLAHEVAILSGLIQRYGVSRNQTNGQQTARTSSMVFSSWSRIVSSSASGAQSEISARGRYRVAMILHSSAFSDPSEGCPKPEGTDRTHEGTVVVFIVHLMCSKTAVGVVNFCPIEKSNGFSSL